MNLAKLRLVIHGMLIVFLFDFCSTIYFHGKESKTVSVFSSILS